MKSNIKPTNTFVSKKGSRFFIEWQSKKTIDFFFFDKGKILLLKAKGQKETKHTLPPQLQAT